MSKRINSDMSYPSFWNNLYSNNLDGWSLNAPTPIFVNWESKLKLTNKNINICIPGCGEGYDAIYFAQKGYNVVAIDFSDYAVNKLSKMSKEKNVEIEVIKEDFFNLDEVYYNRFDFILEYTFYCAINPSKRESYVNQCHRLLKNNGKIIGILFPLQERKEDGPPFRVSYTELEDKFLHKFILLEKTNNDLSIPPRKDNELFYEVLKK